MIATRLKIWWDNFLNDALFRNSIYLMLTTGIMGVLGFFFWLIIARIFTPEEIGVGTTLISAMSLISFISLLGFNSTFVRKLPNSPEKNEEINTGSVLVISAAVIIALVYILLIPYITPKLEIVHSNIWYALGFIAMVGLASINTLTDSIFIAYRAAQYNLLTDGVIMSTVKLLMPLAFVGLGAYGVFASAGLGASAGMVASILFLVFKFGYKPRIKINFDVLKRVFHYSSANYAANLISNAPTMILPIIVINYLGAAAAANFYLAFTIINLLYAVGISVSQSFFAEGSHGEVALRQLFKRSAAILFTIMIPAGFVLAAFGPFILGIFGKSYSAGAADVIVILAIAAPAVAAYYFGVTILRITHQLYSLIFVNIVYAVSVISLSLLWVNKGLIWVAIAWLIGNLIAAGLAFLSAAIHHLRAMRQIAAQQL